MKAIEILTTLAKNDDIMDLSFLGGYKAVCEAVNELKNRSCESCKYSVDAEAEDNSLWLCDHPCDSMLSIHAVPRDFCCNKYEKKQGE